MKTIIVETDQSENYFSADGALKDEGYKGVGKIVYTVRSKKVSRDLYEKDGELYIYKGMDHFNTTIYNVKLGLLRTLKGQYEVVENW